MLFPEDGIGSRRFPAGLAHALNQFYREKGVEVLAGELVSGMTATSGNTVLTTTSGRRIDVGGVVAGLGILPEDQLASTAGLRTHHGIVLDEFLRTNCPESYAAGHAGKFPNPP